jgi:hypothetical protein
VGQSYKELFYGRKRNSMIARLKSTLESIVDLIGSSLILLIYLGLILLAAKILLSVYTGGV